MKTCTKCGESLPHSMFHKQGKRGLHSHCKACKIAYFAEYRRQNPDLVSEQKRRCRKPTVNKPWMSVKSDTNTLARKAVRNAVQTGRLVKPTTCEDCNREFPKAQLHGHHEDYAKPLDVNWLCAPCHGRRHRVALEGVSA